MIGRFARKSKEEEIVEPKSFDDFELKLGDLMRGERATLGKSLLDVQRDLRIKANYIAAIENSDPSAFETPGFVAGYVRSYARYLNMDPDAAYAAFCRESGFAVAHGMSAEASGNRKPSLDDRPIAAATRDPFTSPSTPFLPERQGFMATIEPRAIGSSLVLVALIAGIGYGGWSVLKEVQQVQVAPVEQAPVVLSDLDPVRSSLPSRGASNATAPANDPLNRLYRPQALDVPVLVARDAPISTLDPRDVGTLAVRTELPEVELATPAAPLPIEETVPQVVEDAAPTMRLVAVRPSWVRVRAADGNVIYEAIMDKGDSFEIPATEEAPTLRTGESGALYFAISGQHYGPVGSRGEVTSNLALSRDNLTTKYEVADLDRDSDLAKVVAEAQTLTSAD